jgi:hypothetical protein
VELSKLGKEDRAMKFTVHTDKVGLVERLSGRRAVGSLDENVPKIAAVKGRESSETRNHEEKDRSRGRSRDGEITGLGTRTRG